MNNKTCISFANKERKKKKKKKKKNKMEVKLIGCCCPGSNWGPSVCKTDVITTTPQQLVEIRWN